jgi:hypothetical protein
MPTPFPPNASRILLRRGCRPKACAVTQQTYPQPIANPRQMPAPLAHLVEALVTPDNALQVAITRRNSPTIHPGHALLEGVRQVQAELEKRDSPFPQAFENKQPTTINSATPLSMAWGGLKALEKTMKQSFNCQLPNLPEVKCRPW